MFEGIQDKDKFVWIFLRGIFHKIPTVGAGTLLESGLLLDHSRNATTLTFDSFKNSLIIYKPIDLSNG